jgi:hypothetical protein
MSGHPGCSNSEAIGDLERRQVMEARVEEAEAQIEGKRIVGNHV